MIRSTTTLALGTSAAPRKLSAVSIPRLPRLGLVRLLVDALETGIKAHSTAHAVALGLHRQDRDDLQDKNNY